MLLRIALLQIEAQDMKMKENLKKGIEYCEKASEMGADICLLPEGFSVNYDLEAVRKIVEKNNKEELQQLESECNEFVAEFQKVAAEYNIAIAVPYIAFGCEKVTNSVAMIDCHGVIKFVYTKVHTCEFCDEGYTKPGQHFYVESVATKKGNVNIGTMICFDREFPESARILMLKGAELILVPNNCSMESNRLAQLTARAMENMVAIAMCNAPGFGAGHSVAFDGIAFKDNGDGRDMRTIEAGEIEDIYIANIDMDKLRKFRKAEVWGNAYRNPQLYQELIDTHVSEEFQRTRRR